MSSIVKVHRIEVTAFRIPFRRAFATAAGNVDSRCGLIIQLHGDDGLIGVGEASPHPIAAPGVLREAARATAALQRARDGRRPIDLDELQQRIAAERSPVTRAGFEMACYDLRARAAGLRLAALLGCHIREDIPLNATLDQRDPRAAAAAAHGCVARGFLCLKLKVTDDVDTECRRLEAIRAAVGDTVQIRLDCNGSWTVRQAVAAISRLAVYNIEYVEQPVAQIADLAAVRRAVDVPIAADESVTDEQAVEAIASAEAADVVVVKPTLLGVRLAAEVAESAHHCGLDVVVTSALDTSIGITAAAHLAATLPNPLRACGLATAPLLAADLVAVPPAVTHGRLALPFAPGLGVTLDQAALTRWSIPLTTWSD